MPPFMFNVPLVPAMAEAAALHAPRWNDPTLEAVDCFAVPSSRRNNFRATLPAIIGLYKDRYRDALEPEFMALVDRLPDAISRFRSDRSTPRTLQHADFRLDNILFDVRGNTHPMATLDWQTLTVGPGIVDVAYFLSAGIRTEASRNRPGTLLSFGTDPPRRAGLRLGSLLAGLSSLHPAWDLDGRCLRSQRPALRARRRSIPENDPRRLRTGAGSQQLCFLAGLKCFRVK